MFLGKHLRACLVFLFSTLEGCKNKNIAMGIEIPSGLLNRLLDRFDFTMQS